MEIPTNEVINKRRVTRFHERITAGMAHRDIATFASLVEQYRKENDVPLEQIAAALAALAAGDTPLLLTDDRPPAGFADQATVATVRGGIPGSDRSEATGAASRWAAASAVLPRGVNPSEWRRSGSRSGTPTTSSRPISSARSPTRPDWKAVASARIEIFDEHSTVDMLAGMPPQMFETLKQVKIGGRRLNISRLDDGLAPTTGRWSTRRRCRQMKPGPRPGPSHRRRSPLPQVERPAPKRQR